MYMCAKFLLRFYSENKVLIPYRKFFNLSSNQNICKSNLIALFIVNYDWFYVEFEK